MGLPRPTWSNWYVLDVHVGFLLGIVGENMGLNLSKIPKTLQRGLFAMSTGNGDEVAWVPGTAGAVVFAIPFPYAIIGPLINAKTYPGPYIPSILTQNMKILYAIADISTGSVTIDLKDNGSGIAGLTGCAVTSTQTTFPLSVPYTIANNHKLSITTSSLSGIGDLSFTIVVQVSFG
jgi:hypothetical protein